MINMDEKDIVINELLREKVIQERLAYIIKTERTRKAIKSLGGIEGIKKTIEKLRDSGLTVERAKEMTIKEFEDYYLKNISEV